MASPNDQLFNIRAEDGVLVCSVSGPLRTAVVAVHERLSHDLALLRAYASENHECPVVAGYFDHAGRRIIRRYLYSSSGVEFENWADAERHAHGRLPGRHWEIGAQFMPLPPQGGMVGYALLQVDPYALPSVDAARESGIRFSHYGGYIIEVTSIKLAGNRYWTASFVVRSENGSESVPMSVAAMYEDPERAMGTALEHAELAIDNGAFPNLTRASI